MALISYEEDNAGGTFNVGCSGLSAGSTTTYNSMDVVGTAPVAGPNGAPNHNATEACHVIESQTAPGASASWDSGDWVINMNHQTMDAGTQLTRIDICDNNGGTFTNVVSNYDATGDHSRGSTGALTITINQGSSHSPQSAANSVPYIVFTYNTNEAHGGHAYAWTTAYTVDTPIDDGVATVTCLVGMIPI